MDLKIIEKIKNFLLIQYNHWAFFPVVLVSVFYGEILLKDTFKFEWIGWTICALQPIIGRIIADKCKKKWMFILCNIMLMIGLVALCKMTGRYYPLYLIGMFIYTLCTLNMKLTHNKHLFNAILSPTLPIVFSLCFILLFRYLKYSTYDIYFIYTNIVLIVVYVIHYFLDKYVNEIKMNSDTAGNMPGDAIFKSGLKAIVLFLGILVPLMLFVSNLEVVKAFFNILFDWFIKILRFILSLLPSDDGTTAEAPISINPTALPEGGDGNSIIGKIMEVIFGVIVGGTLLFFLEILIVNLYKYIKELIFGRFKGKEQYESRNTFGDKREKLRNKEVINKPKKKLLIALSVDEKVRRLYQKTLLNDKEYTKTNQSTNNDIEYITAREYEKTRELNGFANAYEKARYSNEVCTKEDYKMMKESIRKE